MNLREPKLLQNVFFCTVVELAHTAVVANARGKKINALFCFVLFAFGHVLGVQGHGRIGSGLHSGRCRCF